MLSFRSEDDRVVESREVGDAERTMVIEGGDKKREDDCEEKEDKSEEVRFIFPSAEAASYPAPETMRSAVPPPKPSERSGLDEKGPRRRIVVGRGGRCGLGGQQGRRGGGAGALSAAASVADNLVRGKSGGKKNRKRERHFVEHDYHDHAADPVDGCRDLLGCSRAPCSYGRCRTPAVVVDVVTSSSSAKSSYPGSSRPGMSRGRRDQPIPPPPAGDVHPLHRKRGGVTVPFPVKLHELLDSSVEDKEVSDVVSWRPHGRCFLVHRPHDFVDDIVVKYFRQTKLTSFQRQLNLYGFCRITKGPDAGSYYHELFLRGRPYLCRGMVRTKIKGTGCKASSSPDSEPDFYSMPLLDPCPARMICEGEKDICATREEYEASPAPPGKGGGGGQGV